MQLYNNSKKSDNNSMKKILCIFLLIFCSLFSVFSSELPEQILGIWEGQDRYVFFENVENPVDTVDTEDIVNSENLAQNQNKIIVVFKTYYGWYLDRFAEPAEKSQIQKRDRNNATPKNPLQVEYSCNDLGNDIYNFEIIFGKNQKQQLPAAIIKNVMYFNFFQKDSKNPNLWNGNDFSKGIQVSEQTQKNKLQCLYLTENQCFTIDYWLTDMDFSDSLATFEYKNQTYQVNKHVKSMGNVYTCAMGKGKKVRNLKEPQLFTLQDKIHTENVLVLQTEPNLVKLVDKNTFEDLIQIVNNQNSKRKPGPKPIFPPSDVDWHWDLIDLLEKDNQIIQQVRQRQKEFGPRAKDFQ